MHQDDDPRETESVKKRRDFHPAVFFRLQKSQRPHKSLPPPRIIDAAKKR